MKKYIAPEMEIAKFAAEDVITASTTPDVPVEEKITLASDLHYSGFGANAEYGTF